MYKKIIIAMIILLIYTLLFSSYALSSKIDKSETSIGIGLRNFFASTPEIVIEADADAIKEPIIPYSGRKIPLNISYSIKGPFSKLTAKRLSKTQKAEIELKIVDKPAWCNAEFHPNTIVYIDISTEPQKNDKTNLSIILLEDAPAFIEGKITIETTTSAVKGPLGILTLITESNFRETITITPDYVPIIDIGPQFIYKEISPLDLTKIPINIKNVGNGETEFLIEIEEIPEKWNIDYPKKILVGSPAFGQENVVEFVIEVSPYKYFTQEVINISCKGRYFVPGVGRESDTYICRITLKNDGSFNEGNGFEINAILLFVVIAAIILIYVFALILKRNKV